MQINKLTIFETYSTDKVIRTIPFKKGMNFIVDSGNSTKKGNGVGKTTFLKLIDICLGANDRKYLYRDYETSEENEI